VTALHGEKTCGWSNAKLEPELEGCVIDGLDQNKGSAVDLQLLPVKVVKSNGYAIFGDLRHHATCQRLLDVVTQAQVHNVP